MATFQENLSHDLAAFGWKIEPQDIPDFPTTARVLRELYAWWNLAPEEVRSVIKHADLSDALWQSGKLSDWPAFHTLIHGNTFGTFTGTVNDVLTAVERAHNAETE